MEERVAPLQALVAETFADGSLVSRLLMRFFAFLLAMAKRVGEAGLAPVVEKAVVDCVAPGRPARAAIAGVRVRPVVARVRGGAVVEPGIALGAVVRVGVCAAGGVWVEWQGALDFLKFSNSALAGGENCVHFVTISK